MYRDITTISVYSRGAAGAKGEVCISSGCGTLAQLGYETYAEAVVQSLELHEAWQAYLKSNTEEEQ